MTMLTIFIPTIFALFSISTQILANADEVVSYCSEHGHGNRAMTSISVLHNPEGVLYSHDASNFTGKPYRRIACTWRLLFQDKISELDDLVFAPKSPDLQAGQLKIQQNLGKRPRFRMATHGEEEQAIRIDFDPDFDIPESKFDQRDIDGARTDDDSQKRCQRNSVTVYYIDGHANKQFQGRFCGHISIPPFIGEASMGVVIETDLYDQPPKPFAIRYRMTRPLETKARLCPADYVPCQNSQSRCIPETHKCDGLSDCPNGDDEKGCQKFLKQNVDNDVDGAPVSQVVQDSGCGSLRYQTGTSGEFVSKNYPNHYPNNLRCVWSITSAPGSKVLLTFNKTFGIEPSDAPGDCAYDSLSLYPRGLKNIKFGERLCGKSAPRSLIIATSWLLVIFETDTSTSMTGFHLSWRSIYADDEAKLTGAKVLKPPVPTPPPLTEDSCASKDGIVLSDHAGFIQSPAYAASPTYPSSIMCKWTIRPAAKSDSNYNLTRLEFRFLDFSIQPSEKCEADFLMIRYVDLGNKMQWFRFCNSANTPPFEETLTIETGTGADLIFRADSWFEERGFELSYRATFSGDQAEGSSIPVLSDQEPLAPTCGLAPKAKAPAAPMFKGSSPFLITGPETVELGTFPWTVQLSFNGEHRCAGAILADRWVVAAANCFRGEFRQKRPWQLAFSSSNQPAPAIDGIYIHHEYGKTPGNDKDFDLAILKLRTKIDFGQVSPICLPSRDVRTFDRCYTLGWHESKSGRRDKLKQIHSPIVSSERCRNRHLMFDSLLTPNMLCAGYEYGPLQLCNAMLDGGSPLACFVGSKWELHGLLSFGKGCAGSRAPDVYTKVWALSSWIQRVVTKYT